ncbi:hypothetical protein NDI56_15535 [Haloarcula sp. S1CR25-12]|uniref:Colicin D C-terminal domain-containing protein n=1 Tax=Haloarcula saliterrae TaxID=2950534 RepID=A0ABU2FEY0_9EURY|nr:colicin D domain-containing protein [Haloarcula sp. S1CR25-12]MDS0260818.1 hypothetical protein [Haloarcula sp. S1CR25-12]
MGGVMRGGMLGIQRMRKGDVHVQRLSDDTESSPSVNKEIDISDIEFPDSQLQAKFKHSDYFGIEGEWNMDNKRRFQEALQAHIIDSDTIIINGEYRNKDAVHYYNTRTNNNVMTYPDGEFWSAWKLREDQRECLLSTGELGGG